MKRKRYMDRVILGWSAQPRSWRIRFSVSFWLALFCQGALVVAAVRKDAVLTWFIVGLCFVLALIAIQLLVEALRGPNA